MSEKPSETHPITVLIVEDHMLTRIGVRAAIERAIDITVVAEASNGVEGVQLFEQVRPDVVLMDVGMPEMDGIEASEKIRSIDKEAKIVMVTSHDNEKDVLASLAAGASGYCLKDAEPERLQQSIRAVYVGDAWLDAAIAGVVLRQGVDSERVSTSVPEPLPVGSEQRRFPHAEPLSAREKEVLSLVVEGLSNQEIADRLIISVATAKTHVRNILNKLAVNDRTQAAVRAMREGLV